MCVPWLIHVCAMTHSYVWRHSFICVWVSLVTHMNESWYTHTRMSESRQTYAYEWVSSHIWRVMVHTYAYEWVSSDSLIRYESDKTHSYAYRWRDSLIRVCVYHDSCVTRLIHMCLPNNLLLVAENTPADDPKLWFVENRLISHVWISVFSATRSKLFERHTWMSLVMMRSYGSWRELTHITCMNQCVFSDKQQIVRETHMNESADDSKSWHAENWLISHVWISESCHTHEWVSSHIWMSHGTHMNASWHTHDWVMPHVGMIHCTRMNGSWLTYEWVMAHIWMSHESRGMCRDQSCHTCKCEHSCWRDVMPSYQREGLPCKCHIREKGF